MLEGNGFTKAQEYDLKAIEAICSDTWEPLYRFIYFKTQNREETEDIIQETYVRAISHIQRGGAKIDKRISFLKTVSLNILRDKWRKGKRQGTSVNFEDVNPEEIAVEDDTESGAQRELIKNALRMLNEEQHAVIELRIIKGYTVAETARIMNKKEGAVRVLQYRALQALTAIIKNND